MRYYLDTEFIEAGPTQPIRLLSIGIVAEDGRSYYSVASDGWIPSDLSPWLLENVMPHLGGPWRPRATIRDQLGIFMGQERERPEIWAYFADYDWVLFCQLFGRMIDLPKHFPFYCRDLKQEMDRLGIKKDQLPEMDGRPHNAFDDALWAKKAHEFILTWKPRLP